MRKILIFMLILINVVTFGYETKYKSRIQIERLKVLTTIDAIYKGKYENDVNVVVSVIGADEALKRVARADKKLGIKNLFLVFPSVSEIENYLSVAAKNVDRVSIILLDRKHNNEAFKNRDIETVFERWLDRTIEDLENVIVYQVEVLEEDLETIFVNSLTKNFFEDEMMEKYIMEMYELEK